MSTSPIASPDTLAQAVLHLSKHDPRLAPIIETIGPCRLTPHTEYYRELVDSIIGQQLSIKAAATIFTRFTNLFDSPAFPSPAQIVEKEVDELRSAGLSRAKAVYIRDLAEHILAGTLQIDALPALGNDEIIRELTAVKGIGDWTAHMFLIFSLGRLDILPVGDLGFRNALQKTYELPVLPDGPTITQLATKYHWHPYESVATWYLWQSLNNTPL